MKYILLIAIFCSNILLAKELKIVADTFSADELKGISIFTGNVKIKRYHDELNATKVTIYTDKDNKPTKFMAIGDVSFKVETEALAKYEGVAQKVIYLPLKKEYKFYGNVHLKQVNEKKEILGNEVTLNAIDGTANANGLKKAPVIMIFDMKDEEKK